MHTMNDTDVDQEPETPVLALSDTSQRYAVVDEIYDAGLASLGDDVRNFLEGGSGEEQSLRRNRDAFGTWEFRPQVMTGVQQPDTSTEILGIPLSLPVFTAPFGADGLFHPEGQRAVARANAAAGISSIVPEAGTFSLETIAQEAPTAARVLQLHPMGTDQDVLVIVRRAEQAGYQALCFTVDSPRAGWRERVMADRFSPPIDVVNGNYAGGDGTSAMLTAMVDEAAPTWTWSQLAAVMAQSELPFICKGILTDVDATRAMEAGAAGVLVSNHGGRQLDCTPAPLDQVEEVRRAVGDDAVVLLDSGVRRGADILKALALGADAVVIGRAAVMALAAGGSDAVMRLLTLLQQELQRIMLLSGRGSVAAIDRTLLQRVAGR